MAKKAQHLTDLAGQLGEQLAARQMICTTAESCTGGLVATSITDIAGSSAWFEQGWVTYSNHAKSSLLGVADGLLESHGAVSCEVVEAMASGAARLSNAAMAVAVSGIAGPGGGTVVKPVGTVWIGWYFEGATRSTRYLFTGDRTRIRLESATQAIIGMIEDLQRGSAAD